MDLRSLLLAKTQTVVLDPDAVAQASTRPTSDRDLDRLEDELAQLGFVMALDLAMTIRRLPYQAIEETRAWMLATLARTPKPVVPLFAGLPEKSSKYLRRVATWLVTQPEQPCPWCARVQRIVALDPCGHLVCRACWEGGNFVGCAICHRRVAIVDPATWDRARLEPIAHGPAGGQLRLLYLAFDVRGSARVRIEALVGSERRMSRDERAELDVLIDSIGPEVATWIPACIPNAVNRATTLARLWMIAPDRAAMVEATIGRVTDATDVLRIAIVLMGGEPSFAKIRSRSLPRSLRRALLGAFDRLPPDELARGARERATLWKIVGERLHPGEHATRFPTAMRAFAIARGDEPGLPAPNAAIEAALRAKDVRGSIEALRDRPDELLRRFDTIGRLARALSNSATQRSVAAADALLYAAARATIPRASAPVMLAFLRHLPAEHDLRDTVLDELVRRAAGSRMFPRAALERSHPRWDLASIHAAARANVIYIREASDWTAYRRRDGESGARRLARMHDPAQADGRVPTIPVADAPMWAALVEPIAMPRGSVAFVVERDLALLTCR